MKQTTNAPLVQTRFFKTACWFEGSLILVAMALGWFADIDPFVNINFSEQALLYGLLGTLPLVLVFAALYQMDFAALRKIRQIMLDTMGASMDKLHWVDLLVLAAIAGIAEELLFRGVLQPWMETVWGMTAGLIVSNVVFGLVHAVTPLYALLAGLVGAYLGLSMDYGGERNLLTPIVIHGAYDFVAFLVVLDYYRKKKQALNHRAKNRVL